MKVILIGKPAAPYQGVLAKLLTTNWNMVCLDDDFLEKGKTEHFLTADAIVSIIFDKSFPPAPNLKLLQAPGAGLDRVVVDDVPNGAAVCNAFGHSIPIAEYCMMSMLVTAHQLVPINRQFRAGDWQWSTVEKFPTHNEIFGKTVCIVGLGQIGLQVAKRAKAFEMQVIGCSRNAREPTAYLDETGVYSDLGTLASKADFLVIACPLSDLTRGLINRDLLESMKPTAVLINVGRGPIVNEQDLFRALDSRTLAGAVLDVWFQYPNSDDLQPRPSQYPFHQLDNVIMTPHLSGWSEEMVIRRWSEIAANLDSISLNKPLINVVRNR